MIQLERRAMKALLGVTMRVASGEKRFRRDLQWAIDDGPDGERLKLTARQARYLWLIVHRYRRQIRDPELVALGLHVHQTDTLPPIYQDGDLRPPIERKKTKKSPPEAILPTIAHRTLADSAKGIPPSQFELEYPF